MEPEIFDRELAACYDRMIRWERRLALERPLFEALWHRRGARSVLDAACGSGAHLELFVEQGLKAVGADGSPGMLELARQRLATLPEERRPPLTLATWRELPNKIAARFDAVLCLGNSLPYVTDQGELEASLAGLWSRVAPEGMLVIQYKNFELLRSRGERFLPLSSHREEGRVEMVAVRQYDWREGAVDFLAIILQREAPTADWRMRHWTTPLATWPPALVSGVLLGLGARVELCGSLALEPFDPAASDDVVLVATTP